MKNPLQIAKEALDAALIQKKQSQDLINNLGPAILETLKPTLDELVSNSKLSKEDLLAAISNIKINVPKADIPRAQVEVKIPEIKVPEPRVTVNIPKIDTPIIPAIKIPVIRVPKPEITINPKFTIPEIKMPEEMDIKGWVSIMGYDKGLLSNPLPVQLRDANGKPISLGSITQVLGGGGGGGGKADYLTIKGFGASAYADYLNSDNRLRVSTETGGAGLTDIELRAAHLDVLQLSGSIDSVYITGSSGSLAASIIDSSGIQYSGSNPLPVVFGASATSASNIVDSTGVAYEGSNPFPITIISGTPSTTAGTILNGDGTYRDTFPISGSVAVSGVTGSVGATILNGDGLYRDTFPVSGNVNVNGALNSVLVTGVILHDAVDDGDAPLKVGGVAIQANPTAVVGGDRVRFTADDLGRQLNRPIQVRDLLATAYVSLTTGTEATLLAANVGYYCDLVYIMGSNNSDVAVTVDIRPVTAGNIVMTLRLPANGVAGVALPVPYPQTGTDGTGNNWTADMEDVTGTTVYLSALFSKEI